MKRRFLIIGNMNAITYKETFPRIQGNRIWFGATSFNVGMYFFVPDNFVYADTYKSDREIDGRKVSKVAGVCWFTNIDHGKRHKPLQLASERRPYYERYDNYDAIEVPRTKSIPAGYAGVMGVPISFLGSYCPEQFEIVGFRHGDNGKDLTITRDGKQITPYFRILIRRTAAARPVRHMKRRFLIIGNKNAITYKEVFPHIQSNRMWVGYTHMGKDLLFDIPEEKGQFLLESGKDSAYTVVNGTVMGRAQACWFTNIDHGKRHKPLQLAPESGPYEKYDNYDAIEVPRTKDIPAGYAGVMGVPISFLGKYCPEQFEIVGYPDGKVSPGQWVPYVRGRAKYARILIRRTAASLGRPGITAGWG